jgi:hypothetical protein
MRTTVISHAAFGCATALLASSVTYLALAQGQPAGSGVRQTELFKTTMDDVLGRVVTVRRTERDPGNGSGGRTATRAAIRSATCSKEPTR